MPHKDNKGEARMIEIHLHRPRESVYGGEASVVPPEWVALWFATEAETWFAEEGRAELWIAGGSRLDDILYHDLASCRAAVARAADSSVGT